MGRKISVDSATLMNKGLELIEAVLLFGLDPAQVEVVVHRQSIVHSLVEYIDGSVLAQLGSPDMRTPIAYALGWPERLSSGVEFLDLIRTARLEFCAPDVERFRCLALAQAAARAGGLHPAILNAANEVAVQAFLDRQLNFPGIAGVCEAVLAQMAPAANSRPDDKPSIRGLEDVLGADAEARRLARALVPTVHACERGAHA
jgi:1-deoxy-D-xylulose-5-phosphate reductoisomerase